MAIRLEDDFSINADEELGPCPWCGSPDRDPDDMDRWAEHLVRWHGYKVVDDEQEADPRTIRLRLEGWSGKARFQVNQRVSVKPDSRPTDYAGRRGTIIGWNPITSEYAVAFDEDPVYGVLASATLEAYEKH